MRALMLMLLIILTTSCASTTGGGTRTEEQLCTELRRALPTWAAGDTERSRREGARFLTVFDSLCP